MWHNCGMTCDKNKKNQKNQKLTCGVDFNTIWSKLTAMIKLNYF